MPPIRADLSKDQGFEIIRPGTYPAVIHTIKPDVSKGEKTAGATTLNIRYRLIDGGSVFDTLIIHPNTMWRVKQTAIAAGVNPDFFAVENAVLGWDHERDETDLAPNETWVSIDDLVERLSQQEVAVVIEVQGPRSGANGQTYAERNNVKEVKALNGSLDSGTGW